ncbi:hypothetical protein GBAR_LOCUS30755 [Geodia barretti]|uniref:Uncharacterized protein n=1 Tax=Geodia barretti TaxID=519541 RepID=A0AA35TY83_GEOBA|nr:hypothetical protein GBAR_LOCUS30755 [Geodia barretti]
MTNKSAHSPSGCCSRRPNFWWSNCSSLPSSTSLAS